MTINMQTTDTKPTKDKNQKPEVEYRINVGLFRALAVVVVIIMVLIALIFIYPKFATVVLNILFVLTLGMIIIFFSLGLLVLVGMRKEVGKILDVFLESSLTLFDVIELLKTFYHRFIDLAKEFLIYVAPVLAYAIAVAGYLFLIVVFKYYGKDHDVTALTIVLTFVSIVVLSIMNRPKKKTPMAEWTERFVNKFRRSILDATEIMILVFFFTMDSTHLFFLPASLNVPIQATAFGVNLMERSIVLHKQNYQATVSLIGLALFIEIVRNILRLIAVSRLYYSKNVHKIDESNSHAQSDLLKKSIRAAFGETKDEVIKFLAFTTVLFAAFMFLPRLKLLTLVAASAAALLMDLLIPARLTQLKGQDLLSRVVIKVFRL